MVENESGGRARSSGGNTAGLVLQSIRRGTAVTRADLARSTGLSRSTVTARLDQLHRAGFLRSDGEGPSTGGRPPRRLAFNDQIGVVLAADLGATHARLAVVDLGGNPLATRSSLLDIADGPGVVLPWVVAVFDELLEEAGKDRSDVWSVGVGLPGPVEFSQGRVVRPPIMPGWDGVSVREWLGRDLAVPVLVDNDVNILTLGEYHHTYRGTVENLILVKVGTGIGCGIIADGNILRGALGAAGDIGHIHIPGRDAICRCGNVACLEAVAGGYALAGQLREMGVEGVHSAQDVADLAASGHAEAMQLVRDAGRLLGESLAVAVNLLNPAVIVLAGPFMDANDQLMAGVREVIYRRSLPLATRDLRITRSVLSQDAGIIGAAILAADAALHPARIDDHILRTEMAAS